MFVELLGLSQNMSFDTGVVQNYVNLQLPNGDVVLAAIDDNAAATLVAMSREGAPTPSSSGARPAALQPRPVMRSEPDKAVAGYAGFSEEAGDMVFGGDATPDDAVRGDEAATQAFVQQRLDDAAKQIASASLGHEGTEEERAARMGNPAPVPHWNNSRRSPTVTKSDYGYPLLSGSDVSDPGEISGDSDEPEEVQQV